jgi:hypothetical protein
VKPPLLSPPCLRTTLQPSFDIRTSEPKPTREPKDLEAEFRDKVDHADGSSRGAVLV